MQAQVSFKIIRRMRAAEGYLELNMPEHALEELGAIDDAGLFEAPRLYMTGYALKEQGRFEEAIPVLEAAARLMPSPQRKVAWCALSECYRECGSNRMADLAASLATKCTQVKTSLPGTEFLRMDHRKGSATPESRK